MYHLPARPGNANECQGVVNIAEIFPLTYTVKFFTTEYTEDKEVTEVVLQD